MRMLALPIAGRELLVLSRAATTWRNRLATSGVVFIFGVVFAVMYQYAGQMPLNQVMRLIGIGLSVMCLFTGVSLTADSIAEERRTGTLGLLFLTNLSCFEIVLGKLIAHAALGFYAVLCALPLLSMSMIFGGMRFGDVLLYVISALNLLLFSAAAGLFASSICRLKGRATSLGTLIVLFFWLGVPGLAVLLLEAGAPQWLVDAVYQLSVNPLGLSRGFFLPPTSTWTNFVWPLILASALIGLAASCLRRWQDEPPAKRWRLREAWKAICYGGPAARLKLRRRLLDRNAFMWLASRDRLQVAAIWITSVCTMICVGFVLSRGKLDPVIPIGTGTALAFLVQLAFSQAAAAQLLREYEQGTLELVLSTPLSVQEVIDGQIAAARRQYRALFATTFLLLSAGLILLAWQGPPRRWLGMTILPVFLGLLFLQFHALGWVAIWSIVKAPDPKRASSNAFFLIAIFPGLMFGLIVVSVQFVMWMAVVPFSLPPELLFLLLFILAFANSIYWLLRARRELPQALRLFAFQRYTLHEPVTFFGKLGKLAGQFVRRITNPHPMN
jgi:ABC-type Na+ efflux pump permease subunit